jgi:hypothetical protein
LRCRRVEFSNGGQEEKGYLVNLIVELLDPKSLAALIEDEGAGFFSTMVQRLNEPLPGNPFVFDPNHRYAFKLPRMPVLSGM